MKAVVIQQYGGPEQLVLRELPAPEPAPGQVLIEVKAFGLNQAEVYFRQGLWGDVAPVSGIECVGVVQADPDGRFKPGQKVMALVGGMGRAFNGSYAEMTRVPAANVVAVDTALPWQALAALPESYATAWVCLFDNLALARGQTLLLRGATSALGQAALNLAAHAGVRVIATTRNPARVAGLQALGAAAVELEGADLGKRVRARHPEGVDAVLELVGNTTLIDSLAATRSRGRVCIAGFLGGGEPIEGFNPILHLPSGVHLSFFGSAFVLGSAQYPLSAIPFQQIIERAADGLYKAEPAAVFGLDQLPEAHRLLESGLANGKIVVRV